MILIEHIWRGRDCTKLFRNLQKTQYSPSPRKPIFFSYSQTWLGLIHGILGFYMYLLYFSDLFWDLVAIPYNRKWNNSQRLNCIEVTTLFVFLFFFLMILLLLQLMTNVNPRNTAKASVQFQVQSRCYAIN